MKGHDLTQAPMPRAIMLYFVKCTEIHQVSVLLQFLKLLMGAQYFWSKSIVHNCKILTLGLSLTGSVILKMKRKI